MGLLKPSNGSIMVNGIDVYDIPNLEKRKLFGYVNQDFHIINGTVAEQISLKDENIKIEQIEGALDFVGLPLRSAIDVVAFAVACMGLNILVGNTGLVSFGHGAWFGLGAYAAALSQRYWFPSAVVLPAVFAIAFVVLFAALSGALILRRRGVYFSLLTLALTALLFAIGYRWTQVSIIRIPYSNTLMVRPE
jgi:hypothetical protein